MESNAAQDHDGTDLNASTRQALLAALPRYQSRPAQWRIESAVRHALDTQGVHAVSVKQVLGQSFALLLAALNSRERVVISVGSVALQHKIRNQDWPLLQQALQSSKQLAVISSRRNQLCPQRLQAQCNRRGVAQQAQMLMQWHLRGGSRDLTLCPLLRDDDAIVARVSCSGTRCESAPCARDDYQSADIVVVTHAWLLSQTTLPRAITSRRLIVDDAHHWFGTALDRSAQTLDIAFWISQTSAFETWLGKHLPLEIDVLQRYLKHVVAVGEALNRSDHIEDLLTALRDGATTLLQAFNHLAEVRGIRIVEPTPWLEYCRWYLQWHARYVQRDDARFSISRRVTPTTTSWLCKIESDGNVSALLKPLQPFAASVFVVAGEEPERIPERLSKQIPERIMPAALQQRLVSCVYVVGAALPAERLQTKLLPMLAADMTEPQRMQAVAGHLHERMRSCGRRWLLLVTQRAQIEKYRAIIQSDSNQVASGQVANSQIDNNSVLLQGDQPKTVLLKRFSAMQQGILVATWQMIDGWDFGDDGIAGAVLDRLPVVAGAGSAASSHDKTQFVEHAIPRAQDAMRRIRGMLLRREWHNAELFVADTRLLTHAWADTIIGAVAQ